MMQPAPSHLAAVVETTLGKANVPGCSIAVVNSSGPVWCGGFGFADIRKGRTASAQTIYHLFSGTKLFTAVAVLQLEQLRLLSLSDPVERFIPEAQEARGVTLLHLLSHRSGLKDTLRGFLSVSFPPETPPTSAEALARYRIKSVRTPGQQVEYRNVNYALLGEVVHRVSGLDYREYVSRHVLTPLGVNAAFGLSDEMRQNAATGYIRRWDPMRLALRLMFPGLPRRLYGRSVDGLIELNEYDLGTSAVGGLAGSMPEFGKFLQAQLAGGGGVLSVESTRRMQTLVAEGSPGIESRLGIGLGWKFGRTDNRIFLNHEGAGAGCTSELRLYPEAGLGIALAMNMMQMPRTMHTTHRICEAVFAVRDQFS